MKYLTFVLLGIFGLETHGQDLLTSTLPAVFESVGAEFGVPPAILKGIAFAETRWQHLEYPAGDTASCTGLPHVYGIMALRDDAFFGHSLPIGASLIGQSPEVVRRDPYQNIRAAAAYLRHIYAQVVPTTGTVPGSLESWQPAVARYCGIPQGDLAAQHAYEVLARLEKGYDDFGIRIERHRVNMESVQAAARWAYAEVQPTNPPLKKTSGQPDYPSARWAPAYPGHWYTTGYKKDFIVVHDMEGYYLSVISYFQQASTSASIHYDVNGMQDSPSDAPAGDITQQVEEQYWAWHAVCLNRYSFGIEHEGFVSNPAWWTPEMYKASANLIRHLCNTHGIPKDRNHIIGHNEYLNSNWLTWAASNGYPSTFGTCNNHTDPGINWDWSFLMQLITEDPIPPRVTSSPPASRLQVFDKIAVTFSQRMDRLATESSFHISPPIQGSFSWSNGFRTMEFRPIVPMAFDAEYAVSLDTTAHNYLRSGLDVNGDGVATGEVYAFRVHTVGNDTIAPQILTVYPAEGQEGISTTVMIEVDFTEQIDPGSLQGAFVLLNSAGNSIPLSVPTVETIGSGVRIAFRSSQALTPLSNYSLSIMGTLRDYGGNGIANAAVSGFSTGGELSFSGTVINDLDVVGSWWQPGTSGSTVGTSSSSFSIATDIKKSGTGSGKVSYVFAGPSGGVVREYNSLKPTVDPGPLVSAWVYGDNSRNLLEYWFYPLTMVPVDTLNWTGWKLVTGSLASVPTTATRQFAGFVIKQVPGGRAKGSVHFDDLAVASKVTYAASSDEVRPENSCLLQNYPNPFNPMTQIGFQVSELGLVTLRVYDMLGREVATLVNERLDPGTYHRTFNASGSASGMYIVRLQAGKFNAVQKIMLIK
jgi:hypothetical protein